MSGARGRFPAMRRRERFYGAMAADQNGLVDPLKDANAKSAPDEAGSNPAPAIAERGSAEQVRPRTRCERSASACCLVLPAPVAGKACRFAGRARMGTKKTIKTRRMNDDAEEDKRNKRRLPSRNLLRTEPDVHARIAARAFNRATTAAD